MFPVPNSTLPHWRTELHDLDSHRSTPELPDKQDIVIVGAGFAGASLAYYLLKDSPDPVQAERHDPGGQTGLLRRDWSEWCVLHRLFYLLMPMDHELVQSMSSGHLRPDVFSGVARCLQMRGLAIANEVGLFELANAEAVTALVRDEGIACDLTPVTSGCAFVDDAEGAKAKKLYDEMVALGCPTLEHVTYHGAEDAESVSGVKGAWALFTFPAATIWPYKMVMHLLALDIANGANLQTNTSVQEVSQTPDPDGYWTLKTPRGSTRARRVVFGTNAYTGAVLLEYKHAIYTNRGTCARIVPVAAVPSSESDSASPPRQPLASCGICVRSPGSMESYYGMQLDGSVIVGGARSSFRIPGQEGLWLRTVDDASLIEPAVPYFAAWAGKMLLGWEDVEGRVEKVWTGIMENTTDEAPHVGEVPGKPGLLICAGFEGYGMPNVLLCAKGLVKVMEDGCPFSETGVPACYETSLERLRAATQH
ncbi:Uu.00g086060.m01.CDS01 [Anthostomella pinea]|uniref:Uu.00g086060.m01.CDS01 n=1 Tax=Anthostomella pinea TaxID=933095 RepID=A0AAI8VN86_9PEZI|nr:Uu.00g086060.m01.CDS01 [Anthostomella pinea]